ncbi:MAG: Ig-like domain-containing protein [Bacteroidota bacterium]
MRSCLYWLCIVFICSCGQQIPPTGGPRDSLPPKLVLAEPAMGAKNFKGNKITLFFDEYVALENPFEKLTYSPLPKSNPNAESKLRSVTIKIKDTLEENTTYSIDFGQALKDINEGNILTDFHYEFSTGPYLDSAFLTGQIILAQTGGVDSTLIVVLHRNLDDSAVAKEKPRYFTRLKGDGSFLFRNLKPGSYGIFGLKDQNGDRKYDQPSELIAFNDRPLQVGSDTSLLLYAFEAERVDTNPVVKKPTVTAKSSDRNADDKRLRLTNNLDGIKQDLMKKFILRSEQPLKQFDTSKLFFGDATFNRLEVGISLDSTAKEITLSHTWKENTRYSLIQGKEMAMDTLGNFITKADTLVFSTKRIADYGSINLIIENLDTALHPIVIFMKSGKEQYRQKLGKQQYRIELIDPGDYDVRIHFDANNNNKWDTGDYWKKMQPEIIVARKKPISIRANWDNEVLIDLKLINEQ